MKLFGLSNRIIKCNLIEFFLKNQYAKKLFPKADKSVNLNFRRYNQNHYGNPKLPDLLYFPHIFRWLNVKYRLKYLQKTWDPEFTEGAFIYGSTRAICRITEIISQNRPEELKGLVEPAAEFKLGQQMKLHLSNNQKRVIKLKPEDIKLLVPIQVVFDRRNDQRKCHILLKTLAMKWFHTGNSLKLALIVLETEFKRDYVTGTDSEWIISLFNILQCALLNTGRSHS